MEDETEDATEFYDERVAIMEFDGGKHPHEAEYSAEHLTRRYCDRKGRALPKYHAFQMFNRGSSAWDEEAGRAYYVPPPPYERR